VKPAPSSPPQAESKIEGKPKEAKKPKEGLKIPMIPVEEGKKSISPPEAEPKKEAKLEEIKRPEKETKVILTPEEVKSIPSRAEPKSERKPQEEGRIAFLPVPQTRPKEEEKPKKEVSPETDKGKFVDTGQPIDITSDKVETYSKENLVLFKGNVTARQKDIVIYADTLEAVIVGDGKGIEKVVASGNVKIQQGLRVANCQQAVFYNLDQKVILTGAPRVWEGNNMVSGNEIIFDIKQDRIEVKGGKDEGGKARIYPEEKIEKLK
jgi:lipopolysaccharide export system protein LptA